jgi:hypothetical protein
MTSSQADLTAGRIATLFSAFNALAPEDGVPRSRTFALDPADTDNPAAPPNASWSLANAKFKAGDVGSILTVRMGIPNDTLDYVGNIDTVLSPTFVKVTPAPAGTVTNPISGTGTVSGGGAEPTFVMSPETPTGQQTTGFLIFLKEPTTGTAAVPTAGGFTVTIWVRNPITYSWAAGAPVVMDYDQAFVTGDLDASEIYVQITGATTQGTILVHFAEQ